jgi:2-polyprenyl-3-methyl-5-hydroxy-6-metoxy-1,4-benzoquinol methylase
MKHSRNRRSERPIRTDWDEVAQWYDQLVGPQGSEYQQRIIIPGVLRLLGSKAGETVVDVACGQGVLCRALAARGVEATGVDASRKLIDIARGHGPPVIHYHVGDAGNLSFLAPGRFDAAACVLAIQNIAAPAAVFTTVATALKPLGRFVLVMMHPCFRGAKETSWGWDEAAGAQYRRIDRYLLPRKTPIVMHPGADPKQYTWTFHRPLESYVKWLRNAGLLIDAMEEWPGHKSSTGARAAAENTARKEIPLFLAIRAIKSPADWRSESATPAASEAGPANAPGPPGKRED